MLRMANGELVLCRETSENEGEWPGHPKQGVGLRAEKKDGSRRSERRAEWMKGKNGEGRGGAESGAEKGLGKNGDILGGE